MNKLLYILVASLILCTSCKIKIKPNGNISRRENIEVQRYDRLESRYLTTGDFSALQQMNTDFPMETRTLIEDVLQIGEVNDPEINSKFLHFYQDTILQSIISATELQYANMNDINQQLNATFSKLTKIFPDIKTPKFYTQIGALDQSIIVGDNSVGISLDKYLGSEYPLYKHYYSESQRRLMKREYIVPDCISFYLLSLYPLKNHDTSTQYERDLHMGKVMWIVNKVIGRSVFDTKFVNIIDNFMRQNSNIPAKELLTSDAMSKTAS